MAFRSQIQKMAREIWNKKGSKWDKIHTSLEKYGNLTEKEKQTEMKQQIGKLGYLGKSFAKKTSYYVIAKLIQTQWT